MPQVQNPLDVSRFLSNPCRLVGPRIISDIGDFDPGEPDVDSDHAKNLLGPGCGWDSKDRTQDISLRIDTVHKAHAGKGLKGIDGVYASKEDGMMDYLQPIEFAGHPGYPAAIAGSQEDIAAGDCTVYVGIANDLVYLASVVNENSPDQACPAAQKVAAAVLDTLKKGA